MGIELTQWTLVKPGRLGAPRGGAPDSVWLKAPSGEMQLLPLAGLSTEARGLVADLASGSKVPKSILGEILAARSGSGAGASAERAPQRPWMIHHLDHADGLYVYLSPPPERGARPVAFSLATLRPEVRRQLELASPGDPVAEDVVAALRGDGVALGASDGSPTVVIDRTSRQ
jgi:hypothetical protein